MPVSSSTAQSPEVSPIMLYGHPGGLGLRDSGVLIRPTTGLLSAWHKGSVVVSWLASQE